MVHLVFLPGKRVFSSPWPSKFKCASTSSWPDSYNRPGWLLLSRGFGVECELVKNNFAHQQHTCTNEELIALQQQVKPSPLLLWQIRSQSNQIPLVPPLQWPVCCTTIWATVCCQRCACALQIIASHYKAWTWPSRQQKWRYNAWTFSRLEHTWCGVTD